MNALIAIGVAYIAADFVHSILYPMGPFWWNPFRVTREDDDGLQ